MSEHHWLKYGAIAIAAVGFIALIGFALSSGGDLEGRTWLVEEITVEGTPTTPIDGTQLTATFDSGGVSGSAGCNSYFGDYTTNGDEITIGPLGSTMMFCEGIQDQETLFLNLMSGSNTFAVDGDTLTLFIDGETVLTFINS